MPSTHRRRGRVSRCRTHSPTSRCFPIPQIDQIAALADITERLFAGPQDIEGVVTADAAIHLVQARPAVRPRTVGPSVEWTNHNLTESFPGVTTAMTYSHARAFYRMSFRDFYRTVGVPERQLQQDEHQLRRMIGYLRRPGLLSPGCVACAAQPDTRLGRPAPAVGAIARTAGTQCRPAPIARPPCHRRSTRAITATDLGRRPFPPPAATLLDLVG